MIIPIEAKSGLNLRSQSLNVFRNNTIQSYLPKQVYYRITLVSVSYHVQPCAFYPQGVRWILIQ